MTTATFTEPNVRNIRQNDHVCVRYANKYGEADFIWGAVTRVFYAASGALRIEVAGLESVSNRAFCWQDQIIAVDPVTDAAEPVGVALNPTDVYKAQTRGLAQGWRGHAIPRGSDMDGTEHYEVESSSGESYDTTVTPDNRGTCTCLDYLNRSRVCKHLAATISFRNASVYETEAA